MTLFSVGRGCQVIRNHLNSIRSVTNLTVTLFFRPLVEVKNYYNPVTSLLCKGGVEGWRAMKPKAQLHVETETPIEVNPDSIYKPIERKERKFNKLFVPKSIESSLPFASKPKDDKKRKSQSYASKRAVSCFQEMFFSLMMYFVNLLCFKRLSL